MDGKGFLESLLDFSFSSFVTTRIIAVLYGILIAAGALVALATVVGGLQGGAIPTLMAIIMAPVVFVLYVIVARVYCEVIIVLFKIADNVGIIAGSKAPSAPQQPPAAAPPQV